MLEAELPMLTIAEPLRDARPHYARFRAIMRGPHLMAVRNSRGHEWLSVCA